MSCTTVRRFACAAVLLLTILLPRSAYAQLGVGTWARTDVPAAGQLMMTIESCCRGGFRISYRLGDRGETMGIKRVDALHAVTILKMNGKQFGITRSTLSADGKTLLVENEVTDEVQPGMKPGKTTEKWALQK
jgi:hypothetical protein